MSNTKYDDTDYLINREESIEYKTSDTNDGSIKEDIMSEEAFNELIDNFEVVETLTRYGRGAIKQNVKKLQKRIKELEEENKIILNSKIGIDLSYNNYIPKQKVKEILIEIQEEYNKLDKEIDKQIKDKNKDYYKCKENIAIMQTLAYCRDKFEELLEEK